MFSFRKCRIVKENTAGDICHPEMDGSSEEHDSGLACLKYLVLGFNTIFLMTGIVLVSIGTTIFGVYYFFNEFLETRFFSPASILLVTGGFIFLIAIIGFISVVKESTLLIHTYCILLCFICLLQLTAGISAILMKEMLFATISTKIQYSITNYPHNNDVAMAMDSLQTTLYCCGNFGPHDWKGVFMINNASYMYNDIILPQSCCADYVIYDDHFECFRTYLSGCVQPLTRLIHQTIAILFGASLTLAIIQLAGISFAKRYGKILIKVKSEILARQILMGNQRQNMYDAMGIHGREFPYNDKPPSYDELRHTFK